jgi:hypothetical protein
MEENSGEENDIFRPPFGGHFQTAGDTIEPWVM